MSELRERKNENGIEYILCGDYYLPEWSLRMPQDERPLGRYGRMRMEYLREHRPILFGVLVLQGKLHEHCSEVNEQVQKRANVMMEQLVQAWGITEEWKSRDQMGWVRMMNQAKHCTEENVLKELIYA